LLARGTEAGSVKEAVHVVGEVVKSVGRSDCVHNDLTSKEDLRRSNLLTLILCPMFVMPSRYDVAFCSIYLLNERGRRALLADTVGDLVRGSMLCPESVSLPRTGKSYAVLSA
jgi:hypothetical protein